MGGRPSLFKVEMDFLSVEIAPYNQVALRENTLKKTLWRKSLHNKSNRSSAQDAFTVDLEDLEVSSPSRDKAMTVRSAKPDKLKEARAKKSSAGNRSQKRGRKRAVTRLTAPSAINKLTVQADEASNRLSRVQRKNRSSW